MTNVFTGAAQQIAVRYLAEFEVRDLLTGALSAIQERIEAGLAESPALVSLGLRVVSVQVSAVSPTAELEKALQTPTRESLQQEADRATFERRALAVEKERAIAENELQNQIELAKREKTLIEQPRRQRTQAGSRKGRGSRHRGQRQSRRHAGERERAGRLDSNCRGHALRD